MQYLFNIIISFFTVSLAFIFLHTVFFRNIKRKPRLMQFTVFLIAMIIMIALNLSAANSGSNYDVFFQNLILVGISILLSFSFHTKLMSKLLASFSFSILSLVTERLSYFYFLQNNRSKTMLDITTMTTELPDNMNFEHRLLSLMLLFFIIMLLRPFTKISSGIRSTAYSFLLLLTPFLSLCLALSPPIFHLNLMMPQTYFLIIGFLLFVNILNYILIQYIQDSEALHSEIEILESQLSYQKNKYQQLGDAYKNIRSFMHDTKKHLFFIQECVSQEKYDEIIPYSENIITDLESRYCTFNTGNLVVDAFVHNLYLRTQNNNISLLTNLNFDNSLIPLNDYHMTIVLGNLLDNSYNACVDQLNGKISLTISTLEDVFTIHIQNTYINDINNKKNQSFEDFDFIHGYGLKNVKDIVNQYNGIHNIRCENGIYSVTIIIPQNKQ